MNDGATMRPELGEQAARFILEALYELDAKWTKAIAETNDEDRRDELRMDLAVMNITKDRFEGDAVEAFGEHAKSFYHYQCEPEPATK